MGHSYLPALGSVFDENRVDHSSSGLACQIDGSFRSPSDVKRGYIRMDKLDTSVLHNLTGLLDKICRIEDFETLLKRRTPFRNLSLDIHELRIVAVERGDPFRVQPVPCIHNVMSDPDDRLSLG